MQQTYVPKNVTTWLPSKYHINPSHTSTELTNKLQSPQQATSLQTVEWMVEECIIDNISSYGMMQSMYESVVNGVESMLVEWTTQASR